jgi:uncharacterized protein YunC (DUF1805 family)
MEKELNIAGKKFQGYEIKIGEKTLVLIVGEKGYLACGYWNLEAADKFNDCCAIITGVKMVEEMLEKKVVAVSKKALELGIHTEMTGKEVLEKIPA